MKKIAFVLLLAFTLNSCEEPEYSLNNFVVELGLAIPEGDNGVFSVLTDSDQRLFVSASNLPYLTFTDTTRILVHYTKLGKSENTAYDYLIKLNDLRVVLSKPVLFFDTELPDSLGHDPIVLRDLWQSKNYLNVDFDFWGAYIKHTINLAALESSVLSDTILLELRHNANNDPEYYSFSELVSFDLSAIGETISDSVLLKINYIDPSEIEHSTHIWFKIED